MARSPNRRNDGRTGDGRGYGRDRQDGRRGSDSRPHGQRNSGQDRRYDDRGRDRDEGRLRERSRDRYDDRNRGARRDHSRDRKRSRERSPVRDRRHDRDRYRDDRDYDDRDRKRARREEDSPRQRRREDSRDRTRPGSSQSNTTPAPVEPKLTAEEEQQAKLAKVQAWKKKVEAKRRLELGLPPELDVSSPGAFSASSPPAPSTNPASPATGSASSPPAAVEVNPASYAGKFDPKAIAKRAAAAMERDRQKKAGSTLGGNVLVPKSTSDVSTANRSKLADNPKVAAPHLSNGSAKPATVAKVARIGLNKASAEKSQEQASTAAAAAPLDEDEEVQRTFEKLPDMPTPNQVTDAASPPADDDQGDAIHSDNEDTDAARDAAMKRALAEQDKQIDPANGATSNGNNNEDPVGSDEVDKMEEDEIDPLDAFMNSLAAPAEPARPTGKGKKQEIQVFNSDDEEPDEIDSNAMNAADSFALALKRKKKDVPTVDHSKMLYEDFRKDFYTESIELAEMTPEEVDELRQELENIKCRGKNPPKPILKWAQAGFGTQILDIIRAKGFEKPSAIQAQALPAIMSGRDIIGIAKTGSGKTLAFVLPMLRHIKDQRPLSSQDGPIGLILAPTRELILQIYNECKPFLKALNLRAVCVYGGEPIKDQIAQLKSGAEIVIGTAGRTIDLLAANSGRVMNLHRVTYVVLDEADRMYDMGNEPSITKILNTIRPKRQTVLFSATFPRNMEALARKALHQSLEIVVGGKSVVAPEITQKVEVIEEGDKFRRLLDLLGRQHDKDPDARTLIFVDKQESADGLHRDVLKKSYPVVSIHGGREQVEREDALRKFKTGDFPIMIATSVAARGLDIKELKLVVNYDCPNHGEDYVHRCGRTGRAGNTGTAVTFVTPEQDRFAPFLIKALRDSNRDVPEALTKLSEAHNAKVKAGEAKKIGSGSGFGGRGIEHIQAQRDAERAAQRKQFRTGDEPEEEEDDAEKKKKDEAKSKVDLVVASATSAVKSRDAAEPTNDIIPSALADHLSNAMIVSRAERPAAAAAQLSANDPLAAAARAASNINNRIGARGTTRTGVPPDNRGPDAGAFHATLEINDFPQKARWGVTNRTNVAKILDSTQTSITSKGIYWAPGNDSWKEAGAQPKLYILVEGDTENQVQSAMGQLTKLLREGTEAAMNDEVRAPRGGRYSVI